MIAPSIEAAIAQYDQNLAMAIGDIKRSRPVAAAVYKELARISEGTGGSDDPKDAYNGFVADMALIGLVTCFIAIHREQQEETDDDE